MKNVLTREELLEAQKAFSCEDWVNNIQYILDSNDKYEILIQDMYLNLIKKYATWKQILYCKALDIHLKMNLPEDAKAFVLEKLKACEVVKIDEFRNFYQENGKDIFILDSKNKEFHFGCEIGEVLRNKYSLKFNEIREINNTVVEEYLNLYGYKIC